MSMRSNAIHRNGSVLSMLESTDGCYKPIPLTSSSLESVYTSLTNCIHIRPSRASHWVGLAGICGPVRIVLFTLSLLSATHFSISTFSSIDVTTAE